MGGLRARAYRSAFFFFASKLNDVRCRDIRFVIVVGVGFGIAIEVEDPEAFEARLEIFPHAANARNVSFANGLAGGQSPLLIFVVDERAARDVEFLGTIRYNHRHLWRNILRRLGMLRSKWVCRRERIRPTQSTRKQGQSGDWNQPGGP